MKLPHFRKSHLLAGSFALLTAIILAAFAIQEYPSSTDSPRAQRITCVNNLRQLGLCLNTWAMDHEGYFPFNASATNGGTMELCQRDGNGFEINPAVHFQVLSNELPSTRIFLCPLDKSKKPALDAQHLQQANVTYLLRSGTNVDSQYPQETLVKCPIDGNFLMCDGLVFQASPEPKTQLLDLTEILDSSSTFKLLASGALLIGAAACVLFWLGWRKNVKEP